jgi:hypothetical protein
MSKALKIVALMVVLLGLGMITGCQSQGTMTSSSVASSNNRVVWEQGITGFPHPKIRYVEPR